MNYKKELDSLLEKLNSEGNAPSLLLHSCCAPCSSYVLEYLSSYFKITVFYYNPNIHPDTEYEKRAEEQKIFIAQLKTKNKVNYIEGKYNTDAFFELAQGMEHEKEGSVRCFACYELRLRETAKAAKKGGFDYFCTTLSVSPYKNADKLNEIGERLSREYGVRYLYSDFKKHNGYKRSIELGKEYNLYRQNYCGCMFSKEASLICNRK